MGRESQIESERGDGQGYSAQAGAGYTRFRKARRKRTSRWVSSETAAALGFRKAQVSKHSSRPSGGAAQRPDDPKIFINLKSPY